jgi:hypothetical protein
MSLHDVHEAVLKNTCRPAEGEEYEFSRFIRCSPNAEGNSQIGTILFVGVAQSYRFTAGDIMGFSGLERAEYDFKLAAYKEAQIRAALAQKYHKLDAWENDDVRFINKIKLIKNWLHFHV